VLRLNKYKNIFNIIKLKKERHYKIMIIKKKREKHKLSRKRKDKEKKKGNIVQEK